MVTISIFWATLMAIIFYVLGMFFKLLVSLLQAVLEAISYTFILIIGVLLLLIGLCAIYEGSKWFDGGGIIIILEILLAGIGIVVVGYFLLGYIFMPLFGLGLMLIEFLTSIISSILETFAYYTEKAYIHFLQILVNKIEKG